jgi:DNA polymerase-1
VPQTEKRWARVEPFNPNSSKQLLEYMHFRGYKIPIDRKTRKPTSSEEAMETILRSPKGEGDDVLEMAIEAKHIKQVLGFLSESYIQSDGRFHSFYTFRPETGRLSSIRPNLQQLPGKGSDPKFARAVRRSIIPDEGKVLVEVDWQAMEAVLTGYFANDPAYIDISLTDGHSHFCQWILYAEKKVTQKPLLPGEKGWKEWLSTIKEDFPKERYEAKRVNLATGYGMQWRHLSKLLRITAADAKKYLRLKSEMAPKVESWKRSTWFEAHTKGYLETPFGYRNYFWNVLEPDPRRPGKFRPGREANEALAFRPQSTGAAMLRETMLSMAPLEKELGFEMLIPVHDAVLLQTRPSLVNGVVEAVTTLFEKEWAELGDLSIPSSATVGPNWYEMEEIL